MRLFMKLYLGLEPGGEGFWLDRLAPIRFRVRVRVRVRVRRSLRV